MARTGGPTCPPGPTPCPPARPGLRRDPSRSAPRWQGGSVTDRLPEPTDAAESPSALLLAYLDFYRGRALAKVAALSESERRTSRLPSEWTPLALLHHLGHLDVVVELATGAVGE